MLVACSPQHDDPPPPPAPATPLAGWSNELVADLRMRWTAAPGIDLLAGPAVPLRAYLESRSLVFMTGDMDDLYPGFDRAVMPSQPASSPPSQWGLWPDTNIPRKTPLVGNIGRHVRSVTTAG